MIVPACFEDLMMQSENTLPNRAYFIPASGRLDDTAEHRERSDRFQLLNGDWKFRYYPSIQTVGCGNEISSVRQSVFRLDQQVLIVVWNDHYLQPPHVLCI